MSKKYIKKSQNLDKLANKIEINRQKIVAF